jgi:hypothetical protein
MPVVRQYLLKELTCCLSRGQRFPVLGGSARMRYYYGAAYYIGYGKYLVHFIGIDALLMAFAQVIFNTIIAAQHHAGYKSQHFLGAGAERPLGISIGVQVEEPVDDLVLLAEDDFIHLRPVIIKFLYLVHMYYLDGQK